MATMSLLDDTERVKGIGIWRNLSLFRKVTRSGREGPANPDQVTVTDIEGKEAHLNKQATPKWQQI